MAIRVNPWMSIVAPQNTCSLFQMYHLHGRHQEGNQRRDAYRAGQRSFT